MLSMQNYFMIGLKSLSFFRIKFLFFFAIAESNREPDEQQVERSETIDEKMGGSKRHTIAFSLKKF